MSSSGERGKRLELMARVSHQVDTFAFLATHSFQGLSLAPWEIAEACVFVGGPGGRFINGETLVVDGGGRHWGEIWTTGKPEYFAAATRLWDDGTG